MRDRNWLGNTQFFVLWMRQIWGLSCISQKAPVGFSFIAQSETLLPNMSYIGFLPFPVSLLHFPPGDFRGYHQNKIFVLKSLAQGLILGKSSLKQDCYVPFKEDQYLSPLSTPTGLFSTLQGFWHCYPFIAESYWCIFFPFSPFLLLSFFGSDHIKTSKCFC